MIIDYIEVMADVHDKKTRSYNMSRIRSSNTKIEVMLGKALWAKGYRYRKNDKKVFGKPDFVLKRYKLAIFCDSEFWHGKDIESIKSRIGTNKKFWIDKIQKNIERDEKVNQYLKEEGWTVLRFWEKEIKKDLSGCITFIENSMSKKL